MDGSQVNGAWQRIEAWLAVRAPLTHASLRAGADPAVVEDAQRRLSLSFPDDLVASLLRHDGCERTRSAFTLTARFRPAAVAEIVKGHMGTEEVLAESEGYWDRHLLMFADTNTDWWLVVDCEPGSNHGRVGTWSGGEGVSWDGQTSIGGLLADVADALEEGSSLGGWAPVAFGGELDWKLGATPAAPAPRSVLAMAAAARQPVLRLPPRYLPRWVNTGWNGDDGCCLTFAENVDPDELLRRFGVGGQDVPVPRETTALTAAEARAAEHSWTTGHLPVMRAGRAGSWSFAFEYGHQEGIRPPVLPRLSAGTRAVALSTWGPELVIMRDGVLVASFSGFAPERQGGEDPAMLVGPLARAGVLPWDRYRERPAQVSRLLAIVLSELGIEFDPVVLTGPLLSGPFLPRLPDRAVVTRPLSLHHGGHLAALTIFAEPAPLQRALADQAHELAEETGAIGYPEISDALDRLAGEAWQVADASPLAMRFRLLAAEYNAVNRAGSLSNRSPELTRADEDAWQHRFRAVEAIMELIAGPPRRAARFVLAGRQDPGWPDQFAADLGPVDIPPGAAAIVAEQESQEYYRAHNAGAGDQVPIWPSRSTGWLGLRPGRAG